MEDYFRSLVKYGHEGMLTKKVGDDPIMLLLIKGLIKILHIVKEGDVNTNAYICIVVIETLLLEFPGKLDQLLPTFIKILCTELGTKGISSAYRLHSLTLISHCFIYNAPLTIKILTDLKVILPVCQNFFSFLRKFSEVEHLRSLIYGITSLIKMEELPDMIKASMPKIIESVIDLMRKYTREKIIELRSQVEEKRSRWDEGTEEYAKFNTPYEQLTVWYEETKDDELTDEDEEDDGLDDDYMWSRSDSCYYKSCLEEKEAPLYFKETLEGLSQTREEYYNAIAALISEENQKLLEMIMTR